MDHSRRATNTVVVSRQISSAASEAEPARDWDDEQRVHYSFLLVARSAVDAATLSFADFAGMMEKALHARVHTGQQKKHPPERRIQQLLQVEAGLLYDERHLAGRGPEPVLSPSFDVRSLCANRVTL